MPRVKPHHHPCQDCGTKTECGGTWEENYDGEPEVICPEFHMRDGNSNPDFVCDDCHQKRSDHFVRDYNAAVKTALDAVLAKFSVGQQSVKAN